MYKKIINIILALSIMLVFTSLSYSWDGENSQQEKRDKEIKIMSNIISTLLSNGMPGMPGMDIKVKGVYLDGYGLVFTVPYRERFVYSYATIRERANVGKFQMEKDQYEMNMDKMKDLLTDFYINYASSIRNVKNQDWITIFVDMGEIEKGHMFVKVFEGVTEIVQGDDKTEDKEKLESFLLSVRFSDIKDVQAGKINKREFENRLKFSTVYDEAKKDKEFLRDLEVLKSIIETSFEDYFDRTFHSSGIQGTYLDDYGVIITADASRLGVSNILRIKMEKDKLEQEKKKLQEKKTKFDREKGRINRGNIAYTIFGELISDENIKEKYKEYAKEIVDVFSEIFADYGHTLRKLKPNDNIAMLVTSRYFWGSTSFSLIMTVKKSDIEKYKENKINLNQFKERVTYEIF